MKKITFLFCLLFAFSQINAQVWTINSCSAELGSNLYGPMSSVATANATSRTAVIYPATQLGALTGKLLTSMYFKRISATGAMAGTPNFKIYLKEVSSTDWGAASLDWATETTGATLVYDSNPATIAGSAAGWKSFPLTGAFTYSGTQNLAVFTEYQNTTASAAITWSYEYTASCINTTNSNTTKYSNNTTGAYPATLASTNYRRPLIGFDYPVSCPAPSTLTTTNITANSVDLNWVSNGTEVEWACAVQPQGTGYPTGAGALMFTNPFTAGGLNPATNYEVYVRANCGLGDNSIWIGPVNFTTPCLPITSLPHLEPFTTFLPTCWSEADNGDLTAGPLTSGAGSWVVDGLGNVGTTGAIRVTLDAAADNDWVLSPEFTIPATGYELKFIAAANQSGATTAPTTPWESDDFVEVLVTSTGMTNWTPLYTFNDTNVPSNTGGITVLDLDAYSGQTIRFAYRAVEGAANGAASVDFSVDNFEVRLTPPCADQTGLVVSGITGSGANTSWDDMSGSGAIGYEYAVTTSATPPASGTSTTNTFYIASGLTPQTVHYLHVRTECAGSVYGAWTTTTFTTGCAPITVLPHLEPFNTFLPSTCWMNGLNGDLTAGPATFATSGWGADGLANAGTTGAIRNNIYTTGANDWVISPEFTIPAAGYELKFDAAAVQYAGTGAPTTAWESDDYIEVLVSSTGTTNWTAIHTYNDTNQPGITATSLALDLDTYATQTVRFAFRAVEGAADGGADIDFSIDNFQVRLSPTCPDQTGLVVSGITGSGANTSWDDMSGSGAIGYEYAVTTSATPPASGTTTTNTFYIASGLAPQTVYYLHVRSECSGSTYGNWSTTTFTTGCAPVTVLPHLEPFATFLPTCWSEADNGDLTAGPLTSGTGSWLVDGLGNVGTTGAIRVTLDAAADNDWVVSPEFTIPATGYELKFIAAANQSGATTAPTTPWESDDFVEVLVTSTGMTNWTPLYTFNDTNVPSNIGSINVLDLDAYSGQTIRFAYRAVEGAANGAASVDFSIDNFEVRLTPPCADQTGLVVSGITGSGANTSWDDMSGSGSIGYEYAVTTSATPPASGTATANTFYIASGLSPLTVYYLHVRTECTGSVYGAWSTMSFTTACAAITSLPWIENFDSVTVPAFPPCWSEQNGDYTTAITSTYNTPHSGTNYLRIAWAASNEFMWTPGFDLVAGTSYDFSSWIQGDGGTGWTVDFYVNNTQNSAGATQLGPQYVVPGSGAIAIQTYAQVTRSFVPATSGTYYFAYRVNQPSSAPWYVAFDDVELKLSPSTPPACTTNLVATPNATCGNFSNNLAWNVEPTATGYYITVGTTSGGTDIANAVNVGTNSYSFTGTVNTQYFWTVVPYNAAGSAIGCTEQSFSTVATGCYCASVPSSNDNLGITTAVVGATSNPIADVTYVDLTAAAEVVAQGANTNVQLTFSTGYTYDINIWIDFNNDYDFNDVGELVKTGIACTAVQPNTVDASFTMPLTAPTGQHRMRIGTADTAQAIPNPCYNGTYGVVLDFTVDTALSSNSFDTTNFVAYPNPVKDVLNLSYKTAISNVRVVNLLGQEVLNTKANTNEVQVDMSALAAGAYIINITAEDIVHTIKVIKE